MSVYLFDVTTYETVWELDITTSEQAQLEAEWTGHAIEDQGEIASYGSMRPMTLSVEGAITAWPLGGLVTHDEERPRTAWATLEQRMRARQPLQLVTTWWSETVAVKSAQGSMSVDDGDKMRVSLELVRVETVQPTYTTIPPSRLRRRVRKHSSGGRAGGGGTTTTPSAKAQARRKSWAAWLVDKGMGR